MRKCALAAGAALSISAFAQGWVFPANLQRRGSRLPPPLRSSQQQQQLDGFTQYAERELGVKLEGCKPAVFEGGLRGVAATPPVGVQSGREFITVPASSCLVTTTDADSPLPREFLDKNFWKRSKWDVRLALLLLWEEKVSKGQGGADSEETTKLVPWLQILPRQFDTPIHWEDSLLSSLGYPALRKSVLVQKAEWKSIYKNLVETSPSCGISLEQFTWAMEVAHSRTFSGPYEGRGNKERLREVGFVTFLAFTAYVFQLAEPEQIANGVFAVLIGIPLRDFFTSKLVPELKRYALIPMIDLVNHKSSVESDVSYNYFSDYFAACITGGGSNGGASPGAEVHISYGQWTNDHLLQFYGFVEEDNPYDTYEMEDFLEKAQKALLAADSSEATRDKIELARSLSESSGEAAARASLTTDGLESKSAEEVMPYLRLLALSDGDLQGSSAEGITLSSLKTVLSPRNESAAIKLLASVVLKEQEEMKALLGTTGGFGGGRKPGESASLRLAGDFMREKLKILSACHSLTSRTQ